MAALEDKLRLLIIDGRAHPQVSDALLVGAAAAIKAAGAECEAVAAPSVFEVPAAIALAEEGGHRPAGVRYDGYVALGCIVRGATYEFEVLANQTFRGLMDLSIGRRLAIGNGILTADDALQAQAMADPAKENRGGAAARACLSMITLRRRLLGQVR
jgi:6,7-dimethyl-8-ribityllumazine synthase